MLNIGQIVYDYTNERVIIFAGIQMLQCQETGECTVESAFILKDGTFIHLKNDEGPPFKYTNLVIGTQTYVGSFVVKAKCYRHYFGIINGNDTEVKEWAKEAIEEVEALIAERGVNRHVEEIGDREHTTYYIKEESDG